MITRATLSDFLLRQQASPGVSHYTKIAVTTNLLLPMFTLLSSLVLFLHPSCVAYSAQVSPLGFHIYTLFVYLSLPYTCRAPGIKPYYDICHLLAVLPQGQRSHRIWYKPPNAAAGKEDVSLFGTGRSVTFGVGKPVSLVSGSCGQTR